MNKYLCIKTCSVYYTGPFSIGSGNFYYGIGGDCIEGVVYMGTLYGEDLIECSNLPDGYMFMSSYEVDCTRQMGLYPKENFLSIIDYRNKLIDDIIGLYESKMY